jgi:hypothetical protein
MPNSKKLINTFYQKEEAKKPSHATVPLKGSITIKSSGVPSNHARFCVLAEGAKLRKSMTNGPSSTNFGPK